MSLLRISRYQVYCRFSCGVYNRVVRVIGAAARSLEASTTPNHEDFFFIYKDCWAAANIAY